MSKNERVEVIKLQDALTKATEILAPQIGIDGGDLAEQKIDVRRMTRLNKLEILAVAYFRRHDNAWVKDFMEDYVNLKMSDEADPRYRVIVDALGMIGRESGFEPRRSEDERSWIQRNITQRNKDKD